MDPNFHSLKVVGYHDQPVPNTYITHSDRSTHLALFLPGYRFPVDMPPMHFTRRILLEQGADIFSVEYAYNRTNFMDLPQSEQDRWISTDVFAACNTVLAQHPYEKITLVGKSIGTLAMAHLLADHRFQRATCLWLTPLLTVDWLCSRIEQVRPHSLFIIGTSDRYYQPAILKQLEKVTDGHAVLIQDASHLLEIAGDIQKSILALSQIMQSIQEFLNEYK